MKLFTLEEAALIALRRSHIDLGHDWVEIKADNVVYRMICACGASAEVVYTDLPKGREV